MICQDKSSCVKPAVEGAFLCIDHAPKGQKYDKDKPRWDLLPLRGTALTVDVLTYGAKKYAPENWRKVEGWRWRYFGAALRHMVAWFAGEKIDPESGHHHLAHAACCVLFMLELDQ